MFRFAFLVIGVLVFIPARHDRILLVAEHIAYICGASNPTFYCRQRVLAQRFITAWAINYRLLSSDFPSCICTEDLVPLELSLVALSALSKHP